jgi:hypothetical protein
MLTFKGAQRDAAVNIQLARDSQIIAEDSKRDSTSMMALSIVAMVFLPGTYTAVSLEFRILPWQLRSHADV